MAKNNTQISATEFKKHFLSLVNEVNSKNSSFIITKRKVPIAKVIPLENNLANDKKSLFGCLKGRATINGDIINCSTEDEWEATKDD
jgi:prevent-host-death family protein